MFYRPLRPGVASRVCVIARSAGDPASTATGMRHVLQRIDPTVPASEADTMETHVGRTLSLQRAAAGTVGIFGGVALLLAAIGLYGVVAFTVAQRTGEVGIRMALGASPARVTRMLIGEVMILVAIGAALGLCASILAAPALRTFLFGVPPGDPLTLAGVTVLLLLVALVASWLPARHAGRIGPLAALRHRHGARS